MCVCLCLDTPAIIAGTKYSHDGCRRTGEKNEIVFLAVTLTKLLLQGHFMGNGFALELWEF